MTLDDLKERLSGCKIIWYGNECFSEHIEVDGADVHLAKAGEWNLYEVEEVSKALGTDAIDVNGGGCESCGYGASITVRGILAGGSEGQ